jgi:hypothetical protein
MDDSPALLLLLKTGSEEPAAGFVPGRSCVPRTGEVAALSWIEKSVNVGDALSLLVRGESDAEANGRFPNAW